MSMFDEHDEDKEMTDRLIAALLEHLEGEIGGGLPQKKGLGVEVQAENPEALKAGLEKAGEVVDKGPEALEAGKGGELSPDESDDEDLEKLKELFGSDEDDEKDKFQR